MKNGFKSFIAKRYFLLILLAVSISAVTLVLLHKPVLKLIPLSKDKREALYDVSTFTDLADNGLSSVSAPTISDNSISYSFTIRDGYEYPYSGLSLFARPELNKKIKQYIDISGYTHMHLNAKINGHTSVVLSLKTFADSLVTNENKFPRKPSELLINSGNGSIDRDYLLTDFVTPSWWFADNKTSKEKTGPSNFAKTMELVFQNAEDSPHNQETSITIEEISFSKNMNDEATTVLAILVLFIAGLSFVRFSKTPVSSEKGDKIIISYDRVEIEDEHDTDVQRIVEYIASNYQNPDFSVEQLAKGAGVSTSKIPTLLKKQYNMNFKQYLNTIRITEAKRLLLETEHQIVTIAHSVGYNNIPHFNRTFKQVTGLSPKIYRESPDQAIDNLPGSGH